jgi:hypothetical protein
MSTCKYMRRFHALMIIPSYGKPPHALHVFHHKPSQVDVDTILSSFLPLSITPTPHLYTEKPQIHVVPLELCIDTLVQNPADSPK